LYDAGSLMRRGRDKKRNLVSTIKKRFSGGSSFLSFLYSDLLTL
jgi:hypothetical protein